MHDIAISAEREQKEINKDIIQHLDDLITTYSKLRVWEVIDEEKKQRVTGEIEKLKQRIQAMLYSSLEAWDKMGRQYLGRSETFKPMYKGYQGKIKSVHECADLLYKEGCELRKEKM
jgi:hypothetical protein